MNAKTQTPAAAKVNAKARTGAKPKAVKSSAGAIRFTIVQAARPGSGELLASYTAAWLSLSGMADGAAIPSKVVRAIAGDTAYAYHTRNGNFERTPEGVKLTDAGLMHFIGGGNRNIRSNPEYEAGYIAVLTNGKPNEQVKNAAFIKPI